MIRFLLGAFALSAALVACSAAPGDSALDSEGNAVGSTEAALSAQPGASADMAAVTPIPIVPIKRRPILPQNRCDATDACTTTPSIFAFNAPFERSLQELGCATPANYANPSQGMVGRKVSRCPDSAEVRALVAAHANDVHKASMARASCGTCLPALPSGQAYVFWTSMTFWPNCPNNCGYDGEGSSDTSVPETQAP